MFRFNVSRLHYDTKVRLAIYGLVGVAFLFTGAAAAKVRQENLNLLRAQEVLQQEQASFSLALEKYKALTVKIGEYQALGVDVTPVLEEKRIMRQHILAKRYVETETAYAASLQLLDELLAKKQADDKAAEADRLQAEAAARLAEAEKNKGTVKGIIRDDGGGVSGATVSILAGKTVITKGTTDGSGAYELRVAAGKYTVQVARSGYTTLQKYNVTVTAQQVVTVDLTLAKAVAASASAGSDSTANSTYAQQTVATSRGSFLTDIMTFNLASGGIKVVTDTVSDGECADDCPVASLSSLVGRHGGLAGMNGTYFCPADYASCANESGSFFWKVFNSRLGRWINQSNGLGENDPTFGFSSNGSPRYFSSWSAAVSSGFGFYAGINSKPGLVSSGQISLNEATLDDKQRTTKSNRGALGLKGQTFYAVIARGATVGDLAAVMQSLGVDYAINVDGGGSSAMLYKGSYKVGPGRGIPNAIIFVGQ